MKRLLASVLGGFLVPFGYIIVAALLLRHTDDERIRYFLWVPIGWPKIITSYLSPLLFGPDLHLEINTFRIITVVGDVILYGTLTYFVLWLRALRKPKPQTAPPPPNF